MASTLPRFLLPRGPLLSRHEPPSLLRTPILRLERNASTKVPPPPPRVLEKPTKFRPPSHGRRLRQNIPRHYGPELTEQQKDAQTKKQYPGMMPPEGSFMYWFLTNRGIHQWICLGTLSFLALVASYENFKRDTPFRAALPSGSDILYHPINSFVTVFELWRSSVNDTSEITAKRRKMNLDDAQKRASYRKMHGMEDPATGLEGWMGMGDANIRGRGGEEEREGRLLGAREMEMKEARRAALEGIVAEKGPVRKWLGIW